MENQDDVQKLDTLAETIERLIEDEAIRAKVRKLIDPPKPEPLWKKVTTNPTVTLFLGFLLTTLVGAFLTSYYSFKQKQMEFELSAKQRERDREKGFYDEINKTRVAKIGEVWETIYELESLSDDWVNFYQEVLAISANTRKPSEGLLFEQDLDRILDKLGRARTNDLNKAEVLHVWSAHTDNAGTVKTLLKLPPTFRETKNKYEEVIQIVAKNRFWIGEQNYKDIQEYIKIFTDLHYGLKELIEVTKFTQEKYNDLLKARDKARKTIADIRNKTFNE